MSNMSGHRHAERYSVIQTLYSLPVSLKEAIEEAERQAGMDIAEEPSEVLPHEAHVQVGSLEIGAVRQSTGISRSGKEKRSHRREKKRKRLAEANGMQNVPQKRVVQKRASQMVEEKSVTATTISRCDLPVAEGGWLGSRTTAGFEAEHTVEELVQSGYQLLEWDGM